MNAKNERLVIEKHRKNIRAGLHYWTEVGPEGMLALGDARWTPDLLLSAWIMAETGRPPKNGMEYRIGASSGGFDVLDFKFLPEEQWTHADAEIDLSIRLNRSAYGANITIPIPLYGGGMSYGSVSEQVMLSRAMAAKKWSTFTSTGSGGYPDALVPFRDNIITQVVSAMFGVREQTIQYARVMELQYAQGAKPGIGGHLQGNKVTPLVAKMRDSIPGVSLFSPTTFHSVYSVEDHRKQVDWIKTINPDVLVSVKVSTPTDVDMVAVGAHYAGAHILHLDGSYGGTAGAPEFAKKNIAMPVEFAIPKVHKYLVNENIRDDMTVIASGGVRTAYDIAKAVALGADGCVLGTADLVALGCTRCSNCNSVYGCPYGLTTTDPLHSQLIDPDWGGQRISNFYEAIAYQLRDILRRLGLCSIAELRGRVDLLKYTGGA